MSHPASTSERNLPSDIHVISRKEFLDEFGKTYQSGQHLTAIGPTQRGKTTLTHQALAQVISPERKCLILAGKPPHRDPVMARAAERLNLRIVEEWPPTYNYKDRKRNGYVLRPHHTMRDLSTDDKNIYNQFGKGMLNNYASRKPVITVVDETHHVYHELGLRKVYEAPLLRGAPHCGEWSLIQRGRNISYLAYNSPEHLIIFNDPDLSNQKRYSEIGGVDPKLIMAITSSLKTHTVKTPGGKGTISECLYIQRSGPQLCIVDVA